MLPLETGGIDLGPLLPEHLSELFAGIGLALIIWFVVAKKVVPVFEKTYAERTDLIAGGIEKAEAAIGTENKVRTAILAGTDPREAYLQYGKF